MPLCVSCLLFHGIRQSDHHFGEKIYSTPFKSDDGRVFVLLFDRPRRCWHGEMKESGFWWVFDEFLRFAKLEALELCSERLLALHDLKLGLTKNLSKASKNHTKIFQINLFSNRNAILTRRPAQPSRITAEIHHKIVAEAQSNLKCKFFTTHRVFIHSNPLNDLLTERAGLHRRQ